MPLAKVRREFKRPYWHARIDVDRTNDRLLKLLAWADRAYKRGRDGALQLRFYTREDAARRRQRRGADEDDEPEPGPPRLERGFGVEAGDDTLRFEIPYRTLSEKDRAVAIREMTDWIHAHLDADAAVRVLPE